MKAFFTGLGLGAAIGALFAPAAGVENRRRLRMAANDMVEQGRDAARNLGDRIPENVRDMASRGVEQARNLSQRVSERMPENVRDMASRGMEQARDLADRGMERARNLRENMPGSVGEVAERAKEYVGERMSGNSLMDIINEWPEERLIEINGIGPVLASKIIQNRPYERDSDLVDAKILPPSAIEALRKAS